MPNIEPATLKRLAEAILDLQSRLEVAESELKTAKPDSQSLDQKRKTRLQTLKALSKPAWFLSHLQIVQDHDVEEFLATIKARP
jgi:hypothetical protein